jgi:putative zinc finger/helix-turn-helix YgiT family protein
METLKKEYKLCMCCMEEHDVSTVKISEHNTFKGQNVAYDAIYEYCNVADEFTATEEMVKNNDISFKDAFRHSVGLLTSQEISSIRKKYGISQSDLSVLLGLGAKTITRYESSQVQDVAYDVMLRKLNGDPEWFLSLLNDAKVKFQYSVYQKYLQRALELFAESEDVYRRKSISALYAHTCDIDNCCGNTQLNFDKIVEVICYFANSDVVSALYKVKLMKLLWYADTLSYKRYGNSITGLAYQALPMGAVPIGHESIIDLCGVSYEEIEFEDGVGYRFLPNASFSPKLLDEKVKSVLDTVILKFGKCSRDFIVNAMHNERAYKETASRDIIQYQYAKDLSIE